MWGVRDNCLIFTISCSPWQDSCSAPHQPNDPLCREQSAPTSSYLSSWLSLQIASSLRLWLWLPTVSLCCDIITRIPKLSPALTLSPPALLARIHAILMLVGTKLVLVTTTTSIKLSVGGHYEEGWIGHINTTKITRAITHSFAISITSIFSTIITAVTELSWRGPRWDKRSAAFMCDVINHLHIHL